MNTGTASSTGSAKRKYESDFMKDVVRGKSAKRKKMKFGVPASKVVHLFGLQKDVTESEVMQLGSTYGKVTNMLLQKKKKGAFLEMENANVAQQMVNASVGSPLMIRDRPICIEFSKIKQLINSSLPQLRSNEDDFTEDVHVGDGAKKTKFVAHRPSRVVHLLGLPKDVTKSEVIKLGISYGKVVNLIFPKGKNEAFLEMEDANVSQQMVDTSVVNPPIIREHTIHIEFARNRRIVTHHSKRQFQGQALLHTLQLSEDGTNPVLRAVVENWLCPITVEVLHTLFKRFGTVLRIDTFIENSQFHALIEMDDPLESRTAKLFLDGQNIYNNCCTLRIEYSKLTTVKVKYNNEKSFDFTKSDLPSGYCGEGPHSRSLLGNAFQNPDVSGSSVFASSIHQNQFRPHQFASTASCSSGSSNSFGAAGLLPTPAGPAAQLSGKKGGRGKKKFTVLRVTNINEEMVTPKVFFTLFGVYGDVLRVRIFLERVQRKNVLVEMAEHAQAMRAMKYLNSELLFGQRMHIQGYGKEDHVQLCSSKWDWAKRSRDFSNSPLHRFKSSMDFMNTPPPSNVLHLSNISAGIDVELIKDAFSKYGTVMDFRFSYNDRRTALIKLSSKADAINCLVHLHYFEITDSKHLWVSFMRGTFR